MKSHNFWMLTVLFFMAIPACKKDPPPPPSCEVLTDALKINQLQVVGSHNSYHLRTYEPIMQFLYASPEMWPPGFTPDEWDYSHELLDVQFDQYGIRSIELDVYHDPDGGMFYNRMANAVLGLDPESHEPALLEPGLKIIHLADVDYQTNYLTFKDALSAVKTWSDAHPRHVPMVIMVDSKEDNPYLWLGPPFTNTLDFDKTALDGIDQEIRDIFGESLEKVITPDDFRGSYATVKEAVLNDNWPTLGSSRGKVLFVLHTQKENVPEYLDGHASLSGRAMFVFSDIGNDETAFINIDDPAPDIDNIQSWVKDGYFVRTRADEATIEARSGDTARRTAAYESGAQIISTDYYRPDPRCDTSDVWSSTYYVRLTDKVARPNPVNTGPEVSDCGIQD
jgi:calcium-dependent phosphoinositide phospholipase C